MSNKISFTLTASFAVVALAASLGAPAAAAASSNKHGAVTIHRADALHRWHHFGRAVSPTYDYVPPGAIAGPGYVFVPGRGILAQVSQPADEHLHERISRRPMSGRRCLGSRGTADSDRFGDQFAGCR